MTLDMRSQISIRLARRIYNVLVLVSRVKCIETRLYLSHPGTTPANTCDSSPSRIQGFVEIECRRNQGKMAERLWRVTQLFSRARDLL